jgi:hypothetical protein
MDELDDALNRVLAIVGSVPKWSDWDRIDQFSKALRPKAMGKRPRKRRPMKDFLVKMEALLAYEGAPRGKKIEAECEVYKRLTGEVPNPELRRKHRERMWAQFKD